MNRPWDDDERPPTDDAADPDQNDEQGKPIGRRIVLGMLGLSALGIAFGKQLQNAQSDVLAPVVAHDPTGLSNLLPAVHRFPFYNLTHSPPLRTAETYRLRVRGLLDRPVTLTPAHLPPC